MRDDQSLFSSNSDNAFLALLTVNTPVIGTKEKVLLALNVKTRSLELRGVVKALDKLSNLSGRNAEAGRLSPDRVTSTRVESSLVNAAVGQSINVG